MTAPLKLPSLGENTDGGDVVKVLVKAGDTLTKDQPILEIETGKATLEVPSPVAGRVESLLVKPGDKVKVGQIVLMMAAADVPAAKSASAAASSPALAAKSAPAKPPPQASAAPSPAPAAGATLEVKLPGLGENVAGGDVIKVLVNVGDSIAQDQPMLEIETGKATLEVPSPAAGVIEAVRVVSGMKIKVGDPVLLLRGTGAPAQKKAAAVDPDRGESAASSRPVPPAASPTLPPPEPSVSRVSQPVGHAPVRVPVAASPAVRRFARELGVNIEEIKGSGAGGRITEDDVKRHTRQINTGRKVKGHCALEAMPLPDFSKFGLTARESMSRLRTTAAEHLSRAWATIPHVTQQDQADITELENLRKRFAPRAEAAGGKLTVTAIVIKILAAALKVHPKFNASVDLAGREIVLKKFYNIGIAVDTERGLLVPVLRDVDKKNIIQISVELGEIARKAREGKIVPDDLAGGTFTITNLGGIGGSFFTPIINAPEVAILGMGRSALHPVFKNGAFEPRMMLPLSLSYDHRLIDGADGARFIRWMVEAIEEPMLISLEG